MALEHKRSDQHIGGNTLPHNAQNSEKYAIIAANINPEGTKELETIEPKTENFLMPVNSQFYQVENVFFVSDRNSLCPCTFIKYLLLHLQ